MFDTGFLVFIFVVIVLIALAFWYGSNE